MASTSKSSAGTNKKLTNTVSQNFPKKSQSRRSKSETSEIVETFIIIPPDGGWGWAIVLTSFLSNFVADGTMYTFGVFLDDISESLGSTPTDIAIANSLMTGFYFLSGPFISALTNRFGYRAVAIIGGFISCASILITSFATTFVTVLVVYGVAGGVGFGMMYVPSIVAIGFYFERWRALATSIAVCGSSLGIIVFPILFSNVLHHTDWRFKFRIISVLCFVCAMFSVFYRPLQPVRIVSADDKRPQFAYDKGSMVSVLIDEERETGVLSKYHNLGYPTVADVHGLNTILESSRRASTISIGLATIDPSTSIRSKLPNPSKQKLSVIRLEKLKTVYEQQGQYSHNKCGWCVVVCKNNFCCCCGKKKYIISPRPLYRDDIFYSGSLAKLPEYMPTVRSSLTTISSEKFTLNYHLSVTRATTLREMEEESKKCVCCPVSVKRTLATMLDLSLLKSPSFVLLGFSGFFTTLGLYTPFMFISERAKQHGMNDIEAYSLISTLGIANTVGRISCGVFSSLPDIKTLVCSYISLMICGVACLLSSLSFHKVWQYGFTTIFGSTIACVAALRPVIIAEMLGLERLTNGFGLCLVFQGVACLIGLPLSGVLKQITGNYELSFYFAGSVILFSALLLVPLEKVVKWENKREGNKQRRERTTTI